MACAELHPISQQILFLHLDFAPLATGSSMWKSSSEFVIEEVFRIVFPQASFSESNLPLGPTLWWKSSSEFVIGIAQWPRCDLIGFGQCGSAPNGPVVDILFHVSGKLLVPLEGIKMYQVSAAATLIFRLETWLA